MRFKGSYDERINAQTYLSQPYIPGVIRVMERLAKTGCLESQRIVIIHDDWCDLTNGRGYCNCNPDVVSREVGSRAASN